MAVTLKADERDALFAQVEANFTLFSGCAEEAQAEMDEIAAVSTAAESVFDQTWPG